MKAYGQDLRDKVIQTYQEGKLNIKDIAQRFKVCYNSTREWIKRFKATGDYSSKQGVGCGGKFRFTNKEAILDFIKNNSDADGITIRDTVAPELPMTTFYDTMKRMGISYKKRAKI